MLRENELLKLREKYFVGKFLFKRGKNFFIALFNFQIPINPIRAAIFLFNRREQGVIFQPIFLLRAELFKRFLKVSVGFDFDFEILKSLGKCRVFKLSNSVELNEFRLAELKRNFYIAFVKQSVRNQRVD